MTQQPTNTGHSFKALERSHKDIASRLREVAEQCYTGDQLQLEVYHGILKYAAMLEEQADILNDEYNSRD